MSQLRHLVHAGSRRRGWYELPAAIASLCPTVISLDLAEVDHQDIRMLLYRTPVPGPGACVAERILGWLVLALSSPVLRQKFPRTVAKTLLPPAERLCTRVEALHRGSTFECDTFQEQTGLQVVRGSGRTAKQRKRTWLVDPCRLFRIVWLAGRPIPRCAHLCVPLMHELMVRRKGYGLAQEM